MGLSCSIFPHVKNSKGEVVESQLFKDSLQLTKNRNTTKLLYGMSMNEEFIKSSEQKFDENGELLLSSLVKQVPDIISKEDVINYLNESIQSKDYPFNEAAARMQNFNKNSQFNEDYLATLEHSSNGKYKLSVVEKTPKEVTKLHKVLSNMNLQERLIHNLVQKGVNAVFLEKGKERYTGRYSTKNAEQTADGLYNLIQVVNGEHLTSDLAEESGHFAVGALGNSPLIQRLERLLTPEVIKELLGEEFKTKYVGDNPRREAMGVLVGRALNNSIDTRGPIKSLLSRIVYNVKRMFHSLSGNKVKRDADTAKYIAEQIAEGYMSADFTGTVENALNTPETLYNAKLSVSVDTYKQILDKVRLLAYEIKNINPENHKKYKIIENIVDGGKDVSAPVIYSDILSLQGIAEALIEISEMLVEDIPSLLNSVNFNNTTDYEVNKLKHGKALREVRVFVTHATSILNIVNGVTSGIKDFENLTPDYKKVIIYDETGNIKEINILDIAERINGVLSGPRGVINVLKNKETGYYLKFLETVYGKNYVERSARAVFNFKQNGKGFIQFLDAEKVPLIDMLRYLETDSSYFERYLASMSNNSDIIGQICDKATKTAYSYADKQTLLDREYILELKRKFKAFKVPKDIIFERYSNSNVLTGNILTKYNWGEYERDYEEFKEEAKKRFLESRPDLEGQSDLVKAIEWENYFTPLNKTWHKSNSKFNKERNMFFPAEHYRNTEYDRIMSENPGLEEWLDDYMGFKESIDAQLPENSIPFYRAPQFKGSFNNKLHNKKLIDNPLVALVKNFRDSVLETFCESSEDTDYGSNDTYNSPEEDTFNSALEADKEKIHRVPLFGINKLKDMTQLNTNIFSSTVAYSCMANTHRALAQIVDALEVGKEVLAERKVGSTLSEKEKLENKSRAYNRYLKFLDKQVYSIGMPKIKIGKILFNKVIGFISRMSGIYLAGNVAGATVNTGTGSIEVFKEAASGEFYNMKDWAVANKIYFQNLIPNWYRVGKIYKEDKLSLFNYFFNTFNTNQFKSREFNLGKNRFIHFMHNSMFLPYSSGDHYMQTMSYLALANHIKVYTESGEQISLYDSFYREKIDINDPKSKYTLRQKLVFKSKEDIETYNLIKGIIEKIKSSKQNTSGSFFANSVVYTQEESDYIKSLGYDIATIKDHVELLEEELENKKWNNMDNAAFENKAREINIRLHGIYNSFDTTAIQQNIYGKAWLTMKGYALGMAERRYGANKYSVALDSESDGTVRTALKVMLTPIFSNRLSIFEAMKALLLPVVMSSSVKNDLLKAGFSENQYRAMRKNFMDILVIATLFCMKCMLGKGDDDDDDTLAIFKDDSEEDTIKGLGYYFMSRLLMEQSAYNTPWGLRTEIPAVGAITPAGVSAMFDLIQLSYLGIGTPFADEENDMFYFQQSKKGAYEKYDSKFNYKFRKMLPYYRNSFVVEHPYTSSESFQYGKKVRK